MAAQLQAGELTQGKMCLRVTHQLQLCVCVCVCVCVCTQESVQPARLTGGWGVQ